MRAAIIDYLPWLLSAVTIWMTLLAGNKHRLAWAIGLCNQALWLGWIIAAEAWGLLPMNLALWVVYGRNHLKWARQPDPLADRPPISQLFVSDDVPLWKQVDDLFGKHGVEGPPWRLRDELVTHLSWARFAQRLLAGGARKS